VLAIESDDGVFRPRGMRFTGDSASLPMMHQIASLVAALDATSVTTGESAADVSPMVERGVPALEPDVDPTRYFWYHHSDADTPDKLDPADMARCVALMAAYAYVAAEMPGQLRGSTKAASH